MSTKVIAAHAGPDPDHTDFTGPEDLMRESSELLEAALIRQWRESEEHVVGLPACKAAAFKLYNQWLYTERFHVQSAASDDITPLLYGYLLGENLYDVNFQDTLIDAMMEWTDTATNSDCARLLSTSVEFINGELRESNQLRRFLVDLIVWITPRNWWQQAANTFSNQFVQDVAIGLSARAKTESKSPFRYGKDPCSYHSHGVKPCYKAKQKR